jgi:uncharacterized protein YyaL (SSP411 family)
VWEGEIVNRLGSATSPYLLQHANNPVDWWPWGEEALAEAKRRAVPLLISVGYAACHWCHVMAHESFENEAVGRLINERFVAVKVDREEHPDVDAVYMAATQAMTGQGGWPMTVFATPDGRPFYCGTYFPRPQFVQLVLGVDKAWQERRGEIEEQGATVTEAITRQVDRVSPAPITADGLAAAAAALKDQHDGVNGGFGGAPKFPPHLVMLFLLRHFERTGDRAALEVVQHTAEAMARGGIYDQLAGGFARYSVDAHWTVPHFEKMLYDNALLLRVYAQLARSTGDSLAHRVARETATFIVRDLGTPEGGFASALDADTDGVEGLTYAWTPAQLVAVLGEDDGQWAAELCEVTPAGTFERGTSVLRLAMDIDGNPQVGQRWAGIRKTLYQQRMQRPQPARDDKVVAAWVGLAITGLVDYGMTAPDPAAIGAAVRAGELLERVHVRDGRLRRVSRDGVAGPPVGVLEDYGCVAEGFAALHQATGDGRWLATAQALCDTAMARFVDPSGGFFDTADDAQQLVTRPADPTDNATPSGLSALAAALVTVTALTGEARYREAAEAALATIAPIIPQAARFTGYAAAVGEAMLTGPYEIAVVGPAGELATAAWRWAPGGSVVVTGDTDAPGVPLLAHRPALDGQATAYVCRRFVCERPVTDLAGLMNQLGLS